MLSIIVCSRNSNLSQNFVENITTTVGVPFEIVHVDNSANNYSIFSAYNFGFSRSLYPYLCFVHEDVLFHTQDWGRNIVAHLQDEKTGILGVAGADLLPRVPTSWATLKSVGHNIIQSDRSGKLATEHIFKPVGFTDSKRTTITLDGVFLCMRRELMCEIHFDENLKGFHGYDYDISIQAVVAGYQNYVVYDLQLEHFSGGKTDILYFRNLILIWKKWEKNFPLYSTNVGEEQKNELPKLERSKLYQLTKKMVRKGFETPEIIAEIGYFASIVEFKRATMLLAFRVFLIRLFNSPKYLFKK